MAQHIRAIPTLYRGTLFRSNLEARWAACFDHLGWYWEYEPYAVDLGNGVRYLCDFHLPAQRCWVEVKGPVASRVDKTNHLRKALPDSELVIIARPPGPGHAANFHVPAGYVGVSIQVCESCGQRCFHHYEHARRSNDGWDCRTCGKPDALRRRDSHAPSAVVEQWRRDVVRGEDFVAHFFAPLALPSVSARGVAS